MRVISAAAATEHREMQIFSLRLVYLLSKLCANIWFSFPLASQKRPPTPSKTPSMALSTCTSWIYNDVLMIKDWTSRKCVLCVIFLMTKQIFTRICRAGSVNGCNLGIQMYKHLIKVLIFFFFFFSLRSGHTHGALW